MLLQANRKIAHWIDERRASTPTAKCLVDNYNFIEKQIREIHSDLPPGYYRQLPKLATGPFAGYPRVFGMAWTFVAHTDSRFAPDQLFQFVRAYQQVQPLTIPELGAVAIMLRIVLVENLRRLAGQIVHSHIARQEADGLADRLLGTDGSTAEPASIVFADHAEGPLSDAFAVQLVHRLRDQDLKITPALAWIDDRLSERDMTVEAVIRSERHRQDVATRIMLNTVTSMRLISDADWKRWYEDGFAGRSPKPVANVPSSFSYGWTSAGTLAVTAGPQNVPVFPYSTSEIDHARGLDACRTLAARLFNDLQARRVNERREYGQAVAHYRDDLPPRPGEGNFMLADAQARVLRAMFAADAETLSTPMASQLKVLLEQHIGLRNFYPEVEKFYGAVRNGRLEQPLPQDAVDGFERTVLKHTPDVFEPEVSLSLQEVERKPPVVELPSEDVRTRGPGAILPPPDPLGELEPRKSHSFGIASSNQFAVWGVSQGQGLAEGCRGLERACT